MKSTYKLLGAYWDGMAVNDTDRICAGPKDATRYDANAISFKDLLSVQDEKELDKIIFTVPKTDTVTLCINYWNDENPVIRSFLEKRLDQIVSFLHIYFQNVYCVRT